MTLLPAVINLSSLNGKNLTDVVGKPCKEPCFSSFFLPVLHSYTCYNKHDTYVGKENIKIYYLQSNGSYQANSLISVFLSEVEH